MAPQNKTTDPDFDDPIRSIGPDATAGFDNTPSNPTEHAGSEALVPDQEEDTDAQQARPDDDDGGSDEGALDVEDIETDEDEDQDAAEEGTED